MNLVTVHCKSLSVTAGHCPSLQATVFHCRSLSFTAVFRSLLVVARGGGGRVGVSRGGRMGAALFSGGLPITTGRRRGRTGRTDGRTCGRRAVRLSTVNTGQVPWRPRYTPSPYLEVPHRRHCLSAAAGALTGCPAAGGGAWPASHNGASCRPLLPPRHSGVLTYTL